jgi:hypothetical protein
MARSPRKKSTSAAPNVTNGAKGAVIVTVIAAGAIAGNGAAARAKVPRPTQVSNQ